MPVSNLRSLSSRLRELKESREYGKAFDEVKRTLLSRPLTPSEIETNLEIESHLETGSLLPAVSEIVRIMKLPARRFSRKAQVEWQDPTCRRGGKSEKAIPALQKGDPRRSLELKEFQKLLKTGNINEWEIEIPLEFKEFGTRWGIIYFYDPSKEAPENFDPFFLRPIKFESLYSVGQDNPPYKLFLEVDLRYPLNEVLVPSFKRAIQMHETSHGLARGRVERYTDEEIFEVKKMMSEGKKAIDILRRLYPQFSSFRPGDLEQDNYEAWAKYSKVKRLMKRVKERAA